MAHPMPDIIARMHWLAEQPPDVRDALRQQCAREGHDPTGERVMINPPLDHCFRCGDEFRRDAPS